jgi:hypothetical protein
VLRILHPTSAPRRLPSNPIRAAIAALGLAVILAGTGLPGTSYRVEAATAEPAAAIAQDWLSTLSSWFAPVSRWTDPTAVTAALASEAKPRIRTVKLKPRPKPGSFAMNLYESGDFVHQQTEYWCVAASIQTMMNIMDDGKPRRSARFQKKLHFQARDLDRDGDRFWRKLAGSARWKQGHHGLGLSDWAGTLTANGYGAYGLDRAPSMNKAVRMAAKAIRTTGRPVGLVVWRGAHAWVMSGFTATADPAYTNDFRVKKVFVQDPWYPWTSSIWGKSKPPNSVLSTAQLAQDYLRYNRPGRRNPMRDGKYMLVLPELAPNTRVR